MLPYRFELIATKQIHRLWVVAQIEANMALPAGCLISPEDGNASHYRMFERFAPLKP